MITTLTPNPCIDRTLSVPRFDLYKMNRVKVLRSDFGGKGINVSSAVKGLGGETCAIGFSFAEDDRAMREMLAKRGVPCDFVTLPGETRVCYKLFDESLRHTIEINESGAEVPPGAGEELLSLVAAKAEKSTFFTLSGSLPKGLPETFYSDCMKTIRRVNPACRIVVDAEKKLLLRALEEHPALLKPNIHEFQETFQCQADTLEALDREARQILRRFGIGMICVSLGAEGAFLTDGRESWHCRPVQVTVRSIQGAGDSVIAGMCLALEQGLPPQEVLHWGVAAAGDSISREGTQFCTREGVEELLKQEIGLRRLS